MSLFPHPPGSGNMHPQPRPLAPAIPSTPQPTSTNPHSILVPPKRTQVVAACEACRHRKAKVRLASTAQLASKLSSHPLLSFSAMPNGQDVLAVSEWASPVTTARGKLKPQIKH